LLLAEYVYFWTKYDGAKDLRKQQHAPHQRWKYRMHEGNTEPCFVGDEGMGFMHVLI